MDDDEKFFNQFQEAPRPEFVAALHQRYQRICQPMKTQRKTYAMRKMALSFAATCFLLIATLFIYPPTRVQALNWIRQIGVFTFTTSQPPDSLQPTAVPVSQAQKPLTTWSSSEATQLAGFKVLIPQKLPEGYAAEDPLSIMTNGDRKIVASLYSNPGNDTFILINQQDATGINYTDHSTGQETMEDVQVNGHAGVWITGRMMSSPTGGDASNQSQLHPSNWLFWEENGIVYSVMSDDLTLAEMQKLAQSLQ